MEQRGTPEVLQTVFVVLPELERKKWESPSPLPQQLLPPWCPVSRADEKGNSIRAVLPSTLPKSALLEPFWTLWEVLFVFPTAADIYLHCLNDVSFLHVPTWPADREEMLSNKATLQRDALLEIFWSRDIIWNCASILKQRLNCQGAVKLSGVQKTEK